MRVTRELVSRMVPIGDRVLVEMIDEQLGGGISVVGSAKQKMRRIGRVRAKGIEVKEIDVGALVFVHPHMGGDAPVGDEESPGPPWKFFHEMEIVGFINGYEWEKQDAS